MSLQVDSFNRLQSNLDGWQFEEPEPEYSEIAINRSKVVFKKNDKPSCIADNPARLLYFQASMFSSVLEDAITQLRLLAECNNELRVIKLHADLDALLRKKFGVVEPETVDELEAIDPTNLTCGQYKLDKLAADRKYVKDVLTENYQELSVNSNFSVFQKNCDRVTEKETYYNSLTDEVASNKGIRRDIYKQLRQQRNHIKSVVYDAEVAIDALKSKVEDSVLLSETSKRYTDNWQRARTEQHIQTIQDLEAVPSAVIAYYKQRQDNEERVHAEVDTLTQIFIAETFKKVEDWMTKYEKDMEAIDLKIQIQKNDYQVTKDKRMDLEYTIEKHDTLMKEWIHFKEEREKARKYVEKMTKSAITVQAWWRGLLVRLQLGPYKVAKKGKGKGKKK